MKKRISLLASVLVLVSFAAFAQEVPQIGNVPVKLKIASPEAQGVTDKEFAQNSFGAGNLFYTVYQASQFMPRFATADWTINNSDSYIYPTTSAGYVLGQISPDIGTMMHLVRFFYYDNNAGANPTFYMCKNTHGDSTGASPTWDCSLNVTPADTQPGYSSVRLDLNITHLTQEGGQEVFWTPVALIPVTDGSVRFSAARLMWSRQVSPGPVAATFLDVPTSSPIFKFVEALAAAGITGGCGGGNYCPSSPVTRGQMAVFISQALGLAWNN